MSASDSLRAMSYALVLGGGGTVGVSWSIGILASLGDALGLDPAGARVTIGTSAGAVVAAMLGDGNGMKEEVERERLSGPAGDGSWATSFDISLVAQIFQLWTSVPVMSTDVARAIGERASRASSKTDEDWVWVLKERLGERTWPAMDIRLASVNCETGERRVWSAADGADLVRVVSASSAVPGIIPPVRIDGVPYMDGGVWSLMNSDLLVGMDVTDVLLVAPQAGGGLLAPGARATLEREQALLRDAGFRTHAIVPGPAYEPIGANAMDAAMRAPAVEIGLADGVEWAKRLAEEDFDSQ
jgi:NTE family protein